MDANLANDYLYSITYHHLLFVFRGPNVLLLSAVFPVVALTLQAVTERFYLISKLFFILRPVQSDASLTTGYGCASVLSSWNNIRKQSSQGLKMTWTWIVLYKHRPRRYEVWSIWKKASFYIFKSSSAQRILQKRSQNTGKTVEFPQCEKVEPNYYMGCISYCSVSNELVSHNIMTTVIQVNLWTRCWQI